MRRLVRRLLLPPSRPARSSADAGLPGLLAGGIALLGVAAVPMTAVVVDTVDRTSDDAPTASPPMAQGEAPSTTSGPIARVGLLPSGGVREALDAIGDDEAFERAAGTPGRARTAVATTRRTAAIPDLPAEATPDGVDGTDTAAARNADAEEDGVDAGDDPEAGGDATGQNGADDEVEAAAAGDAASDAGDAGASRPVWDDLADCESGDWDAEGRPIQGTARWDYGLQFAHEGYEQFQGGLNFHPDTWRSFKDADMPDHAGHAGRAQQITVGERIRDAQGWQAWPVCSEMLGLR